MWRYTLVPYRTSALVGETQSGQGGTPGHTGMLIPGMDDGLTFLIELISRLRFSVLCTEFSTEQIWPNFMVKKYVKLSI